MASVDRQFRGVIDMQNGSSKPSIWVSKTYARLTDAKRWVTRNNSQYHGNGKYGPVGTGRVEYADPEWKVYEEGVTPKPGQVAAVETEDQTLKRGWVVSISDSWTNDPTMPLGHMIGTELYKALCEVYDQAQAIGEKPGKLIIESEKNDRYRCTDYHITLYTEKVE